MTDNWLNDNAGGNGGPGVYFGTVGHRVAGVIEGTPRPVPTEFGERFVIELKATSNSTALKGTSGEDGPVVEGDQVTLWVKPGAMAAAIKKAITEAGATGLTAGDSLVVAYTGDGEKRKAGWNAPKLYGARYTVNKSVSVDDLIPAEEPF